ncbi:MULTISPECIES: galactose-1-phosphate uridylyltransferase [unclassified Arthrobacter]|uniref:galactose-1-phosphate uridylyltransferase n=1 Tax=unclassified Arthrobacter TaxID=235627 RepID=UPI002E0212F2|nr:MULTISPECIES: galactose-1-phosphate uridylyltransferase [unclassified Arthrobacter]MEC5192207.1 UDPglucose--hexose-1-phosphate uridylyltransferase [Arthrobacter sp. MP_M4]MEC5203751.1 UDPglucose--hexose-1-phosphate uridylyltransferase [Arthrobacter sp. MP_M7]
MAGITKRAFQLADGRDIIYFDDADTTLSPERSPDLRVPAPRPRTATMRQDVLTGEWISVASARQNRIVLPPTHLDPLAPASAQNPSEIPSLYDVAVFENKSPSFGPDLAGPQAPEGLDDLSRIGLGRSRQSVGRCEVVCFSPEHTGSLAGVSTSRMRTVVEAWADRTAALSAMPGVQQVFPFENRGEEIGVTLHHPHGQIYAYPFITPRTQQLIRSVERYGSSLFEDVLDFERTSERVVLHGEHWTAFVPFAARWPLELHVLPHRQIPDLAATRREERDEFALLYGRLLRGVDALYSTPTPYISAWHQAPVRAHRDDIRLMLQLTSPRREENKLKYLAGSEAAMGAFIADIAPETAAARLREAVGPG